MDKLKYIDKVLLDIHELKQQLIIHDMDLLGLEILIVETGEIVPIKIAPRST